MTNTHIVPITPQYVIRRDNLFVAIDKDSGGYPYYTKLLEAHRFATFSDAKHYADMFYSEGLYEVIVLTHVTYEVVNQAELIEKQYQQELDELKRKYGKK